MTKTPPVLFIAGTGQHSGKTLVSLGLVMHARALGLDARYMKPVGQRTVEMDGKLVDEDVVLLINACQLGTSPEAASPITLPSGFTRDFLTAGNTPEALEGRILEGFAEVADGADIVIAEGTGHAGVGSVVDLSNARVASLLGAEVVIVTSGGIGKPIDELCLNQALFAREGVHQFGVVFNKVLAAKMEETRGPVYAWGRTHGENILGMIPYDGLLSKITVGQIAAETGAVVHSGHKSLGCLIEKIIVGAESPHRFLGSFGPGVLALIPGDREDLILAAVSSQHTEVGACNGCTAAICLTSGILPHPNTMAIVKRSDIPMLTVEDGMFAAASRISDLVAKMTSVEAEKIERAQEIVARHLDFVTLHQRFGLMQEETAVETTLALIKPEAVQAGLVGIILARFERAGLRPVAMRLLRPSRVQAGKHYGEEIERKYGRNVREWLLDYLTEGPVVVALLQGPEAVRTARAMAGEAACPAECAAGTIRADLSRDTRAQANASGRALRTLIHTSDSPEAARREAALWFGGQATITPAVLASRL